MTSQVIDNITTIILPLITVIGGIWLKTKNDALNNLSILVKSGSEESIKLWTRVSELEKDKDMLYDRARKCEERETLLNISLAKVHDRIEGLLLVDSNKIKENTKRLDDLTAAVAVNKPTELLVKLEGIK